MTTIQEFITKHNITIKCEGVPENPNMCPDLSDKNSIKWNREAAHFHCVLRHSGPNDHGENCPRLVTYYSMGSGHARLKNPKQDLHHWTNQGVKVFPNPECDTVLDCLASDASGYENSRYFADWASEYGYDTDSRKAENTYRIMAEQCKELRHFLGSEAFAELMECERM